MNLHRLACTFACLAAAFASPWAAAQARIQAVPHSPAPAAAANTGLPNPAGLNLAMPSTAPPSAIPGATTAGIAGAATATLNQPLGASSGGGGVAVITNTAAAGGGTNSMGAGAGFGSRPSAVDIARLFMQADTNRDGELSRMEAQRVGMAMVFDDLDTNHDGVVSRSEFEESFR